MFFLGVFSGILLPFAYFLGRAGIAAANSPEAREAGRTPGAAQRWLLYPPVVLVSLILLLGVLTVPVGPTAVIASETERADRHERWELAGQPGGGPYSSSSSQLSARHPEVVTTLDRLQAPFPGSPAVKDVLSVLFLGAGLYALWLGVLGLLAAALPGFTRGLFFPLLNGFEARHGRRLGVACLVVFALWAGFAYRIGAEAGVL
jgi:hypothetical protein